MVQLMLGDCLEKMKDIPDKSVDMILTDLPYGTTACKWDIVIPFEPMWEQYKRIIKDRGAVVLFSSEPFSSYLRMSNIKDYKYDWVWNKVTAVGFQIAKYRPMQQHEIISIFGKNSINYYPIMIERPEVRESKLYGNSQVSPLANVKYRNLKYTHWYPKSIITESNADHSKLFHPTQKPVDLLEYLIKTYSLEGETVLDSCMGSGSTGVACINTNRSFIGIEWSPVEPHDQYYNIACKRIQDTIESNKTVFDII